MNIEHSNPPRSNGCRRETSALWRASKQSLASLVFGQDVLIDVVAIARSGLSVGKILIGEFDINLSKVRHVMAWVYERYARERNYLNVQIEAKKVAPATAE
jgi:endonuclease YncB( thermonuclease family)